VRAVRGRHVEPDVVFADEPTGALDQRTSTEVIQLLTFATRDTGAALVMVAHDADVAAHCDRILHVRDGRISGHSQYRRRARAHRAAVAGRDRGGPAALPRRGRAQRADPRARLRPARRALPHLAPPLVTGTRFPS
jgi:energy-coupling factor transporter ATP-binding protein EcfA2